MFVDNKVGHPGCNPLRDEDRKPILKVVSGDTWVVDAELVAPDGGPASPKNCLVEFVLSENQFSPPMWTGRWMNGVVPDDNRCGLVHVKIPREVTRAVRRGSYMFSIRVSDLMHYEYSTQLIGNFLVEYLPTSDQHSIPYRDGTSEIFSGGESKECENSESGILRVRNEQNGLYYKVTAVGTDDGEITLDVSQNGTARSPF
jgi:hypothetical protein